MLCYPKTDNKYSEIKDTTLPQSECTDVVILTKKKKNEKLNLITLQVKRSFQGPHNLKEHDNRFHTKQGSDSTYKCGNCNFSCIEKVKPSAHILKEQYQLFYLSPRKKFENKVLPKYVKKLSFFGLPRTAESIPFGCMCFFVFFLQKNVKKRAFTKNPVILKKRRKKRNTEFDCIIGEEIFLRNTQPQRTC